MAGQDVRGNALRALWVIALAAALPGAPLAAAEAIERFHADIAVQADGSIEVTETIAVHAEGSEIRRGIVREFPTRYRDRFGNRVVVGFEMIEALRNGQPEPFWTERVSNGVEIFLGDDSFLVVPQTHTYTLRYRTTRQLGFFEDFDELYWNVTGTGWIFPILSASAHVRLPQPVPAASLDAEAYTGAQGAAGRDYRGRIAAPGEAVFETTQPLGSGEGLTIVLTFPKGIVTEPAPSERLRWLLADNGGVLVALGGLLLLLAWYGWMWHRKGRDPDAGAVFPRYQPPRDHSPGGVRYLRRMGWDDRCFSSDLVDAAVHGALTIHRDTTTRELVLSQLPEDVRAQIESSAIARKVLDMALKSQKDTWRLERNADADMTRLAAGQQAMAKHLFAKATMLTLQNSLPSTVAAMQAARAGHKSVLKRQYSPKYFVANTAVAVTGFVWTLLFAALALVVAQGSGLPLILLVIVLAIAADIAFVFLMRQPTAEGRRLLDEIEGLRMYLGVAEKDELARMSGPGSEPALDSHRYEALLPYALALEVEEAWTGRFAAAAAAAGADAATRHTPAWYRGDLAAAGGLAAMSESLGNGLSSQIASSSSSPGSSSGSGGGGSSGGGGGGGGGRGR